VHALRESLKRNDWTDEEITVLGRGDQPHLPAKGPATLKNIFVELKRLVSGPGELSGEPPPPGSVLYFHFNGHGGRYEQEMEPEELSEKGEDTASTKSSEAGEERQNDLPSVGSSDIPAIPTAEGVLFAVVPSDVDARGEDGTAREEEQEQNFLTEAMLYDWVFKTLPPGVMFVMTLDACHSQVDGKVGDMLRGLVCHSQVDGKVC
jgi:hypothetical protein